MSETTEKQSATLSRREWLRRSTLVLGAVSVAPLLFTSPAEAASKMAQSAVDYRPHPKGSEMCSNCKLYIPASNPKEDGACKAVAGKISPNGWCDIYVPKA
ncbi:MAG: high-potential iron-sulfur protein [Acidithiobacillus sp.]|nr:high-potential iron-sulfur protein [Acidithiobacillus sp.]